MSDQGRLATVAGIVQIEGPAMTRGQLSNQHHNDPHPEGHDHGGKQMQPHRVTQQRIECRSYYTRKQRNAHRAGLEDRQADHHLSPETRGEPRLEQTIRR